MLITSVGCTPRQPFSVVAGCASLPVNQVLGVGNVRTEANGAMLV